MIQPRIHLTSIPAAIKQSATKKIEDLGGSVLDPHHTQYNDLCTHLVVYDDETKPTERVLAALAAGVWIVRLSWVGSSTLCGYWVAEEPHECRVGSGLPLFHRLRATAARAAVAQSACVMKTMDRTGGGGVQSAAATEQEAKSGAIFAGWTMCIVLQKSSSNRSFRRVLAAGGATVIKGCDLGKPGVNERLNLVLTDSESLLTIREVVGHGTPIAKYFFLRDVLLQKVDPSEIKRYLYAVDYIPPKPTDTGPRSNPILVEMGTPVKVEPGTPIKLEPGTTPIKVPATVTRRPTTLRRRNRTITKQDTDKNHSIKEYFHVNNSKSVVVDEDVVVIDDDDDVAGGKENVNTAEQTSSVMETSFNSDVVILNDECESMGNMSRKRLKGENGQAINTRTFRQAARERYSVDSEADDHIVSLELDDNDDIQVVSDVSKPEPMEEQLATALQDSSIVEEDDCCYITAVSHAKVPVTAMETNAKSAPIKAQDDDDDDDDDCCIMDVVPLTSVYSIANTTGNNSASTLITNSVTTTNTATTGPPKEVDDKSLIVPCIISNSSMERTKSDDSVELVATPIIPISSQSNTININSSSINTVQVSSSSCESGVHVSSSSKISDNSFKQGSDFILKPAVVPATKLVSQNNHSLSNTETVTTPNVSVKPVSSTSVSVAECSAPTTSITTSFGSRQTNTSTNVSNGSTITTVAGSVVMQQKTKDSDHTIANGKIAQPVVLNTIVPGNASASLVQPKAMDSNENTANGSICQATSVSTRVAGPILNMVSQPKTEDNIQSTANGKIPQSATLNIIGKFLEIRCCFAEAFSGNLNRCSSPYLTSESLLLHSRVQTKGETGLYWSSVRSTSLLGIDVSNLNSLSVIGGPKTNSSKGCNHTSVTATGNCVNCHMTVDDKTADDASDDAAGQGRGAIVDQNDVDVVVNSLMWLKLGITPLHHPNPELIGDMLARYVIKTGVPVIQSEALSVANYVLLLRPCTAATRRYYADLLQAIAATAHHPVQVPLGSTLWAIVDSVSDMLAGLLSGTESSGGFAACDSDNSDGEVATRPASGGPASCSLNFDKWQYEQHLFDLLGYVMSVLDQDMAAWKNTPVQDLIAYRLLMGYSNNPAVLPKTAVKFIKLWLTLSPQHCTPTQTMLRHYVAQIVSVLLELVWLWHGQRQSQSDSLAPSPIKGDPILPGAARRNLSNVTSTTVRLSDCMAADDLRFAPLATEMALALRGVTTSTSLALVRELPLARHRLFLASILPTNALLPAAPATTPATPTIAAGEYGAGLQHMIRCLSVTCSDCDKTSVLEKETQHSAKPKTSLQPTASSLDHFHLVQLLLLQFQAYIHVTGAVHVVKNAVRQTTKKKKVCGRQLDDTVKQDEQTFGCNTSDIKKRKILQTNSQEHALSPAVSNGCVNNSFSLNEIIEYYDLFGTLYSREYLNEYYKRFSCDRKVLSSMQSSIRKLTNSCKHIHVLRLFMALLYMK